MSVPPDPGARAARADALRAPLAIAAVLLFVWPLVRVPRLSLAEASLHLFAAWALLIAVLFAVARAAPRRRAARQDGARDDGA